MKKISRVNIIIMALAFITFAIVAYLTNYVGMFNNFDLNTVVFFHNIAINHSLVLPKFITDLGYGPVVSMVLIISTLIFSYHSKYKEAVLLNLAVSSGYLSSGLLKEFFKRLRPALDYHMIKVEDYSFPSGHMLIAVCLYGTLIYTVFRLVKITWLKYTFSALLTLIIILIGLSRVYLGVHYPTDITGGLFLGLFIMFLCINLYNLKAS